MSHLMAVLEVENPHVEESFQLFKSPQEVTQAEALEYLVTTARIHLDNAVTTGIIQSVNVHRNQQTLDMKRLVNLDLTDKVVYSCPICYNYMVGNDTLDKAKYVIVTKHCAMDDRVIVLDLVDNDKHALVEYGWDMVAIDKLADNVVAELNLKAQLFVASSSGTDYKCIYPE